MMTRKRRGEPDEEFEGVALAHVAEMPPIVIEEIRLQRAHRRAMEMRAVDLERLAVEASIQSEKRGDISASRLAVLGLCVTALLILTGHDVAGTTLFSLVASLTCAFIWGRMRLHRTRVRVAAGLHQLANDRRDSGSP